MNANIGDRVRFRSEFLRSTGQYTGEVPRMRGEVIERKAYSGGFAYLKVKWDSHYFNDTGITSVLEANLEVIKRTPF